MMTQVGVGAGKVSVLSGKGVSPEQSLVELGQERDLGTTGEEHRVFRCGFQVWVSGVGFESCRDMRLQGAQARPTNITCNSSWLLLFPLLARPGRGFLVSEQHAGARQRAAAGALQGGAEAQSHEQGGRGH